MSKKKEKKVEVKEAPVVEEQPVKEDVVFHLERDLNDPRVKRARRMSR